MNYLLIILFILYFIFSNQRINDKPILLVVKSQKDSASLEFASLVILEKYQRVKDTITDINGEFKFHPNKDNQITSPIVWITSAGCFPQRITLDTIKYSTIIYLIEDSVIINSGGMEGSRQSDCIYKKMHKEIRYYKRIQK